MAFGGGEDVYLLGNNFVSLYKSRDYVEVLKIIFLLPEFPIYPRPDCNLPGNNPSNLNASKVPCIPAH